MVCVDFHCSATLKGKERGWSAAGLQLASGVGLSGDYKDSAPPTLVAAELGFGSMPRYHLLLGYEHLSGFDGLRFEPATFGFPIEVGHLAAVRLAIEPLASLVTAEFLAGGGGHTTALGAAVRALVVLEHDHEGLPRERDGGLLSVSEDVHRRPFVERRHVRV
jgi:hypothetical protein